MNFLTNFSCGKNSLCALRAVDKARTVEYNGYSKGVSWGVRHATAFTHIFIKGFRVVLRMPSPRLSGEGSKQAQVSALPERRVKKRKRTALMGYFFICKGALRNALFSCDETAARRREGRTPKGAQDKAHGRGTGFMFDSTKLLIL